MRHPQTLLDHFETVSTGDNVSYVLSPQRRLTRINAAWELFARQNDGERILSAWSTGSDVLAACGPRLRAFYENGYSRACAEGTPWHHEYECSSPERYRRFLKIAYPYNDWLLVTHSLIVERAHDAGPYAPESMYMADGLVVMCSHCRRTRYGRDDARWDWVPSFVANITSDVSHGLCGACLEYYYPEA